MRWALTVVVILTALGLSGWYGMDRVPVDFSYGLEAEFIDVPPDDDSLSAWVRSQPGVYRSHVQRVRVGDRWRVEVIFGIIRDSSGQPLLPDVDTAAAELGYRGSAGRFRDSPR